MEVEDRKTTFVSASRDLELIVTTSNGEEYQLPTQKYHQEKRNKTGLPSEDQDTKQKQTFESEKSKLTNQLLKLYRTPMERDIPLKRARNVQRKGRNPQDICLSLEGRHRFESTTVKSVHSNTSSLHFSRNLVNDYIMKGVMNNTASCSSKSQNSDQEINDERCTTQGEYTKRKTLEQIRPSHPGFRKETVSKPGEALKVNGMILADRLKVRSIPKQTATFENIQETKCLAPKHWWNYLNEKITKTLTTNSSHAPSLCRNKLCKLCRLNPENQDSVQESNFEKSVLHIDLKRLTQVRSKDWSSYGHFTRIHKLRYTKRQKNLEKVKEHRVDVDEDYLNVDVDRLMKMYEQKGPSNVELRNSAVLQSTRGNNNEFASPCLKTDDYGVGEGSSNKGSTTFINDSTTSNGYTCVQRPGTTTLRSCLNFTSRKTCFPNVV